MIWIWVALVLGLVVMLVLFGVSLFRKAIGVLQAFSDLVGETATLDGVHRAEPELRPLPAVLAGRAVASERWASVSHRRRQHRAARHQRRLDRAKRITTADVSAITRLRA